jgi:hypothetical protein
MPVSVSEHSGMMRQTKKLFPSSLGARAIACGILAIVTSLIVLTGCQSAGKPGSSSLAAVMVPCNNSNAIYEATVTVFEGSQWSLSGVDGDRILFEKEGTKRDNILYGNWGDAVWFWAEVRIQPNGNTHLLRCDVFVQRNHGDGFLGDSTKLRPISSGKYKDMLERIKKKVGPKPG